MRLPVHSELETIPLAKDNLLAVLPADHPLADCTRFPLTAFCMEPFILLGREHNEEIMEFFEQSSLKPMIRFTTWDDYAIMSMVENGLGISILHELILKRTPYHIITKELETPFYRTICLALRSRNSASLAVRRFLEYLQYR